MITIVTRMRLRSSAVVEELAGVAGSALDEVQGWSIAFALGEGESRIIWLKAWIMPLLPVAWPVRVTNAGGGFYNLSRPFPWIFGGSGVRTVMEPQIKERHTSVRVATISC